MPLAKWTKLSSEVFHENKWWKGIHDRFRLPNGKEGDYYFMSTLGAVLVVGIDADGKVLLHRQYRYLFDRESLELPCGGIKPGQTIEAAALTEFSEETGFKPNKLKKVGEFASNDSLFDEMVHVFVGSDLVPTVSEKDETENFELVRLLPNEIDATIVNGGIWDGLVIAGWTIAKPYLKI